MENYWEGLVVATLFWFVLGYIVYLLVEKS